MSDRMTCPGCAAHTSSVLDQVSRGFPCPYCQLSAEAIMEITAVRVRRGDEALKLRVEQLVKENSALTRDVEKFRRFKYEIDSVVEGFST